MRDPIKTEPWIEQQGVAYEYMPEVNLEQITVDKQAKENIRLSKNGSGLHQDKVEQYAIAMQGGSQFPPLVVYPSDQGFRLINGMHRTFAYRKANIPVADCYVLNLDEIRDRRVIERLQRNANILEGINLSVDECYEQAVHAVKNLGMTIADAARQYHLNANMLGRKLRVKATEDRAMLHGLPGVGKLKISIIELLSRLKRDQYFVPAITLAVQAPLSAEQTKALVHAIEAASSDEEVFQILAKWRQDFAPMIAETAGGKMRSPTTTIRSSILKLNECVKRIATLLDKEIALTTDEREFIRKQLIVNRQEIDKLVRRM